jgi:ATP-binding cassette, subfamily C, bacterial
MTQKSSRPTAALVLFLRDLLKFRPGHLAAVFALMLARSLTEGLSFVLLIPILGLGAGSPGGPAGAGQLPQGLARVRALFGEEPSSGMLLALFLAAILLRAGLGYTSTVVSNTYLIDITNDTRQRLYTALSRASWLHLAGSRQADDTRALTSQISCVNSATWFTLNLASGSLTLLSGLSVAMLVSPQHTLAVLAASIVLALPMLVFQRWSYQRGLASVIAQREFYAVLFARMNGLKLAKAFAIERQLEEEFAASVHAMRVAEIASQLNAARANLIQDVAAAILLIFLVYVALAVLRISNVELVILIVLFARLTPIGQGILASLRSLAGIIPDYQLLKAREAAALVAAEPLPPEIQPVPLRRFLAINSVGFTYPDASIFSGNAPVLTDISVTIAAGSAIGILGRSGAGKSTLADIMAGLIPPDRGRIVIDGVPIDEVSRAHWRASVAYVPQDAPLFHDTLRANLRIGARQASDAEIWASLETVHAAELVRSLPQGLDTQAGDRGVRLSGGERQRLRLASALLRRPQLLILDESTNALSPEDEAQIIASLQAVRGAMTVILIAHRTTSVMWTDRVLILRDGRIAADGPPGEVLAAAGLRATGNDSDQP